MTKNVELADVAHIIREHLGVEADKPITLDSNFETDFGADSLDMVELLMAFEEEYAVEMPDNIAQEVETVGQCIIELQKRIDAKDPQAVS